MNLLCSGSSHICLISWLLYFLQLTLFSSGEESCQLDDVFNNQCGEYALCFQEKDNTGVCECMNSYKLVNGKCVKISEPSTDPYGYDEHIVIHGGSSFLLWILIPSFILILAVAIFLIIKRLKLVEKLYQFRVRRYNTVFVTSLQDDDAPIT